MSTTADGGAERTLTRATGALFVAGFVLTVVGSGRWNNDFDNPDVAKALATVLQNRGAWLWINAWMMIGLGATSLGYVAFRETVTQPLERFFASIAAALFFVATALGVAWLSFRYSVEVDAAGEAAASGAVPVYFPAVAHWANQLFYAHLEFGFVATAALGLSALSGNTFPKWFGMVSLVMGIVFALGFAAVRGLPFTFPEWLHLAPLIGGITLLVRKKKSATSP